MRFLILSITLLLLAGCTSAYRALRPIAGDPTCRSRLIPRRVSTGWYRAGVDVTGHHLSGLLFIKNMPDSAQRIVFTSEAGVTFFDFEFSTEGLFRVHSVIAKMNHKPVLVTLQQDFSLLLGIPFRKQALSAWASGQQMYYGAVQKKGTAYFVTNQECSSLQRLELGSRRKRKVAIGFVGAGYPAPDTIQIHHFVFPMQIQLVRFLKE